MFLFLTSQIAFSQNVVAWGANDSGQADVPASAANVVAVAAGASNSLALRADGTVLAWGSISSVPGNITNATAIAAGAAHNLVLLANGTVLAWGSNTYGQVNVPPSASNVVAIAAGDYHALALRSDGRIVAWGRGTTGQPLFTNIIAIAAGGSLGMVLRNDGDCFIWSTGLKSARTFRSVNDKVAISAGAWQQVALTAAGLAVGRGASVPASATNLIVVACATNYSLGLGITSRSLATPAIGSCSRDPMLVA